MILAMVELDEHPESPAQWDRYYNTLDDAIYFQTLPTTDIGYPEWVEVEKGAAVREDMRILGTLTQSKYSAKDFQTYKDQIVAWMFEKYGDSFNDFMSSDPAIMIVEYVAAALDQMSWYLDREADEWYPELARLTSNIARMARLLGYKATPAVSGTTDLDITLTGGPYGFDVPIYEGHQVAGPNLLIFEVDADYIISAGLTEKSVTCYQGQSFTEVFISTGDPKQVFNLSLIPADRFLAQEKTLCKVSNVKWDEEEVLPYSDTESYEINYLNDPPQIRFGDGIIGKIPAKDAEIRITYIATAGKLSMQAIKDTIQVNVTPVVVNFETIPISVNNPAGVVGAADPETNESIVANSPRYYDAADRLVTKRDIETLADHFSDPLYGSVSKSNALSIRNASQDLQLRALLDAIISDVDTLTENLNTIDVNQDSILAITGVVGMVNSIRWAIDQVIVTDTPAVRAQTAGIDDLVVTSKGSVDDTRIDIQSAQTRLEFLSAQQVLGYGDKTTTEFHTVLVKGPIKEGSVAVFLDNKTPSTTAEDGDCDSNPGTVYSVSIAFVSSDVGKLIKIGGEYRQILNWLGATAIVYSGPRIYGTSLIVEVYPDAIIGYDDGAGNISGTGVSGTIVYSSGSISITFAVAPAGISGQYGEGILATYQYVDEGTIGVLNNAVTHCDEADANIDAFTPIGTEIDTIVDTIDGNTGIIGSDADAIDAIAVSTKSTVQETRAVPTQMYEDIAAVEAYIDTVISGECKANIVRISLLVLDANGFYTAPSQSLIGAAQTYMDARRIETVRYSVVRGDYYLLLVDMLIEVKVEKQYIWSEVEGRVEKAANDLLKARDYGVDMPRKQYYDALDIEGVNYVNITITGMQWAINVGSPIVINDEDVPVVDSQGNLFINEDVIISKGAITLSEITT